MRTPATPFPWSWSVSVSGLKGKSHPEIISILAAAGFDGLEGHEHAFEGGTDSPAEVLAAYTARGLRISSFHLPYGWDDDLAHFDEGARRQAVDHLLRSLDLAAALGARVCVTHPTISRVSVESAGFDTFLSALSRSMEVLIPRAASLGLTLAIENMCVRPPGTRFGSLPEHFERFRAAFDDSSVGFCYDSGHALMTLHARALDILEAMGRRLAHLHLADNAGDRDSHLAPGRGLVNWNGVFQRMRDQGFQATACIETPPFAYGPDYSPDAWAALLSNTRALARMALGG